MYLRTITAAKAVWAAAFALGRFLEVSRARADAAAIRSLQAEPSWLGAMIAKIEKAMAYV